MTQKIKIHKKTGQKGGSIPLSHKKKSSYKSTYPKGLYQAVNFKTLNTIRNKSVKTISRALGITEKTYRTYSLKGKLLSPVQAEWVLAYKNLQEFGIDLFQDSGRFDNWLNQYSERINAMPNEIITTVSGIQDIQGELERITEGYPA